MLSLKIKSSSYMCLDIVPGSIIHKHLVKKLYDLTENTADDEGYNSVLKSFNEWDGYSKHYLTELPKFHISLGAPLECNKSKPDPIHLNTLDTASLVGLIALAPINISKKDDKKSAWIPLYPTMLRLMQQNNVLPKYINLEPFHSMNKELHISLANLTGNPRDSIARPEDCIIDTITA